MGRQVSVGLALCWVGRTAAPYARLGVTEYVERIGRYRDCHCLVVPEERRSSRYSDRHRLEREGRSILGRLEEVEPCYLVVVDPRGKSLDSRGFAELVRRRCYEDARTLTFVVGGPDGLPQAVRDRGDRLLSLSRLTLPHDLARLVLVEQLYRAFTLIHHHPYGR